MKVQGSYRDEALGGSQSASVVSGLVQGEPINVESASEGMGKLLKRTGLTNECAGEKGSLDPMA